MLPPCHRLPQTKQKRTGVGKCDVQGLLGGVKRGPHGVLMDTCASHRSDQYDFIEPYSHIDLAPPDDLKVVPHKDLEILRALPPRPMSGGYIYNSTRHNILWNDRSRSIVRVYKGDVKYGQWTSVATELSEQMRMWMAERQKVRPVEGRRKVLEFQK